MAFIWTLLQQRLAFSGFQTPLPEELVFSWGWQGQFGYNYWKNLHCRYHVGIFAEVSAGLMTELDSDGLTHLDERTSDLREETCFKVLVSCVDVQKEWLKQRHAPSWTLSFNSLP
ncbi:hypothetical protein NMG60_11018477 [Bertholletia excelsa]